LNFLRHYTDIGFITAVIYEPIEAKAVVEMTKKRNVMLQPDVGAPPTAATATATASAAGPATAATAYASASMATEASAADTRMAAL